jgi:hypothetical protein
MMNALKPDATNRWTDGKDKDGNYIIPFVISGKYCKNWRRFL